MAGVFSSAAASSKRELVIRKESSSPESSAIESGDYADLFDVTSLNHLQVSGFSSLTSFSPRVGRLEGMLQLILTQNSLTTIPCEFSRLTKLKHLDLSQNSISTLPAALYDLHSLHTLIISHNALTDDSFPPAPEESGGKGVSTSPFPNLHHIDVLQNRLTKLPVFVYGAPLLQELIASDNVISVLEPTVGSILGLKQVDMKRNKLTSLPYELTACSKIRMMRFEENPLSDRRLLKLVAQHGASKPKAVLDYIASHTPKPAAPLVGKAGRGKGGSKPPSFSHLASEEDDVVVFAESKVRIQVSRPAQHVEVKATAAARAVRPYLVCAIVRGIDLEDEVAYREFITLQTRLHDTVCKRRRVATIATHNLNAITPPLQYDCGPAPSISFTPLNWTKEITARQFLRHLDASKQEKRGGGGGKGKKGGGATAAAAANPADVATVALSKYLQFVNAEAMVYLQDQTNTVISLPPLTNCVISKIDSSTTDLFLEVTSAETLGACKQVMDSLVLGMCERGLGVGSADKVMVVEQVKVVDESRQLLVLYPSRTDLTADSGSPFEIIRPQ